MINAYDAGMFEQIKRLFRSIYNTEDWFLFHIDASSDLLREMLKDFVSSYHNAFVSPT